MFALLLLRLAIIVIVIAATRALIVFIRDSINRKVTKSNPGKNKTG